MAFEALATCSKPPDEVKEQSLTSTASVHPRTPPPLDVPTLRSMTQLLAGGAKLAAIKLNVLH